MLLRISKYSGMGSIFPKDQFANEPILVVNHWWGKYNMKATRLVSDWTWLTVTKIRMTGDCEYRNPVSHMYNPCRNGLLPHIHKHKNTKTGHAIDYNISHETIRTYIYHHWTDVVLSLLKYRVISKFITIWLRIDTGARILAGFPKVKELEVLNSVSSEKKISFDSTWRHASTLIANLPTMDIRDVASFASNLTTRQ